MTCEGNLTGYRLKPPPAATLKVEDEKKFLMVLKHVKSTQDGAK